MKHKNKILFLLSALVLQAVYGKGDTKEDVLKKHPLLSFKHTKMFTLFLSGFRHDQCNPGRVS